MTGFRILNKVFHNPKNRCLPNHSNGKYLNQYDFLPDYWQYVEPIVSQGHWLICYFVITYNYIEKCMYYSLMISAKIWRQLILIRYLLSTILTPKLRVTDN